MWIIFLMCVMALLTMLYHYQTNRHHHQTLNIALITKHHADKFNAQLFKGAQDATIASDSMSLHFLTQNVYTGFADQEAMIDKAMAEQYDAIIISVNENPKVIDKLTKARERGMIVILIDSPLDKSTIFSYIGSNNHAMGQNIGELMDQLIPNRPYHYLTLTVKDAGINIQQRDESIKRALKLENRGTQFDSMLVGEDKDKSAETIYRYMSQHESIEVIVGLNETSTEIAGKANALLAKYDNRRLHVVGFDTNYDILQLLETQKIDSVAVQNPYAMGYLAVQAVRKAAEKNDDSTIYQDTSYRIVNRDTMFEPQLAHWVFPIE